MFNFASIAVAVVVLVSGAVVNYLNFRISDDSVVEQVEVLSEENQETIVETDDEQVEVEIESNLGEQETKSDEIEDQQQVPVSAELIYPDSTEIETGVYESSEDPDVITDWYEEKIRSMGFNVKSFVKSKVNGEVENKLSAANSEFEINIEIKKSKDSDKTQIKISE